MRSCDCPLTITGTVDLDMVSLYPVDTWKHRPNGLRKDLVQLLYDMHPGFLRFPGGCIVEGRLLATRYRWKTTIGDIANRKTIINRWNDEFDTRPAPDYFQSFGLGFYEYFQLAEDIGAQPAAHPELRHGLPVQLQRNGRPRSSSMNMSTTRSISSNSPTAQSPRPGASSAADGPS